MQTSGNAGISALQRVLVIDDDPVSLSLTALLLEAEGLEVEQKASGEDACREPLPEGWAPDLILTDLRMPGLHGSALATQLAERWPGVHRIAMSAAAPEPVAGYAAVLQKPLPMEGLRAQLEELCQTGEKSYSQLSQIQNNSGENPGLPTLDEAIFAKLERSMQPAALKEFIDVMLADTASRIEKIQQALHAGDTAAAQREAHTLRGAAGMTGALALKEVARIMETEVDSLGDLDREFARLQAEHQRLSVILASKLL